MQHIHIFDVNKSLLNDTHWAFKLWVSIDAVVVKFWADSKICFQSLLILFMLLLISLFCAEEKTEQSCDTFLDWVQIHETTLNLTPFYIKKNNNTVLTW